MDRRVSRLTWGRTGKDAITDAVREIDIRMRSRGRGWGGLIEERVEYAFGTSGDTGNV